MSDKRFDYTNYSYNLEAELNAESFQILYEQYKDALKIIKDLEKENEQLNKKLQIYKSDGLETLHDLQRCYENIKKSMKRVNVLEEENEQLKKELFETSKELLWATSDDVDRALYFENEVKDLRKEIFGNEETRKDEEDGDNE